jgi:Trp operon repressor
MTMRINLYKENSILQLIKLRLQVKIKYGRLTIYEKGDPMQEKINKLLIEYKISFRDLAQKLNVSNHTLTRKVNGSTEWTYSEIMLLTQIFHIEDPQSFFYD